MAELRSVDPRTLLPNPNNPRRTPAAKAMDDQLVASIRAIGLIQPPRVTEVDGTLVVIAGDRRRKAAVAAKLAAIDVLVCDPDETADAMRSISENLIRASMNSVDIWRATENLEAQGWNEQAIADALALPPRTIKRLKLLAHLHPAMLDFMANGSMPNEDQLRTIAAAAREEQAQVWKKHKPKKGHDVAWYEVARALSQRRMPFSAAKFDEALAAAYGVTWDDDLFAPPGEDGRTTTNVEGFFGAQGEWLQANLPQNATLLPTNEYGSPTLPKKAQHVYSKPGKGDLVGHYLDNHSGEVRTIAYRLPEAKKASAGSKDVATGETTAETDDQAPAKVRADVTRKGCAMIGDLRTEALHHALQSEHIDDHTLLGMLVLAFAGKNVTVQSGGGMDALSRDAVAATLASGGLLTADPATLRKAARAMLAAVLSCRDNMSDSGPVARIAGEAIGASLHLPNMATEEFLSCVSKAALETAASAEGVRIEARGKDTRARMVERFKNGVYVHPSALFKLTPADMAAAEAAAARRYVPGRGWVGNNDANADEGIEGSSSNDDMSDGADNEADDGIEEFDATIASQPAEQAAFADAAD